MFWQRLVCTPWHDWILAPTDCSRKSQKPFRCVHSEFLTQSGAARQMSTPEPVTISSNEVNTWVIEKVIMCKLTQIIATSIRSSRVWLRTIEVRKFYCCSPRTGDQYVMASIAHHGNFRSIQIQNRKHGSNHSFETRHVKKRASRLPDEKQDCSIRIQGMKKVLRLTPQHWAGSVPVPDFKKGSSTHLYCTAGNCLA